MGILALLRLAALPALFLAAITGWHQFTKAREEIRQATEARAVARGRQQCISEVELATAKAEAEAALRRAASAQAEIEAANRTNEEVRGDVERIRNELAAATAVADRNAAECGPDRRLSDGVLNLIRGDQGAAKGKR